MRVFRFPLLASLLLLASSAAAQTAPAPSRPLSLEDLAKVRTVRDPQVSPDGKWVAYTVGTVDVEKDEGRTGVFLASWDGTRRVRMTTAEEGGTSPRFSPDGRWLSFLSKRGTEEEKKHGKQVWLLDRTGGEAVKLTDLPGGVSDHAWSPDAKKLVLVASDPDPDDEPEKKEGWKRKTKPPIVVDRYHFKEDREGYLGNVRSHLWLFDVATRKAEALTSGPYDDELPSFSPDGRLVAFVSRRGEDPDRGNDANVFVVEARPGAAPRALTSFPGEDGGRPAFSPDGKWVAYLQGAEVGFTAYAQQKLAVVPAAGGEARILASSLDRPVDDPVLFTPDGKSLLFSVVDDRSQWIGRTPLEGGAVERLTTGPRVVQSPAQGGGKLAVLAATDTELPEVCALEEGRLRRLTHENDDWLAAIRLGVTEEFTSRSRDGAEVHGLVTKPAALVAGTKNPALLLVHGGPNGQDDHAFDFDRELLAANGYVVLAVNYRGSSGRGEAFQKAIHADWGNLEVLDLLGAVDQAVAAGIADPERLGIGGWSYGGILTDYTIATDGRFKAAVSGAGSANQLSMYGVDEYVVQYDNELGPPWKSRELWLKLSYPFFQAEKIRTPTLFLGGEKDFNVPIAGGEQMYQALRSLRVPTQLVVYPGQFHGLTTPSYRRDRLERYLAWFDRYLKPASAAGATAGPSGVPPSRP